MKHLRIALLAIFLSASPFLQAEERIALVVGVGDYEHIQELPNPPNDADADAVAAVFKKLSFKTSLVKNPDIDAFQKAVFDFQTASRSADVAAFFFAGHGIEFESTNYLIPSDAQLQEPYLLKTETVNVTELLDQLEAPVKLVILDCCRDNPYASRSWARTRSAKRGLAALQPPRGSLIMFAAAPGETALDGTGSNSPFTLALVQELPKQGVSTLDAFFNVSDVVLASTGNQQEPWVKFDGSGRLFRDMIFAPGTASNVPLKPIPMVAPPQRPQKPIPEGEGHFVNSLGMRLVAVPGTDVLFSIWETRVKDYAAYAAENHGVSMDWVNAEHQGRRQTPEHPVVNVTWTEATSFCSWLSKKEGKLYRLPTDHEWSIAVGIGSQEDARAVPEAKDCRIGDVFPWGRGWPPPRGAGNYHGAEGAGNGVKISGYRDDHPFTASVGSYSPNPLSIYNLGGNVWEWCEDAINAEDRRYRTIRGGSWNRSDVSDLLSSSRRGRTTEYRSSAVGFRVVLESGPGR